MVRVQLGVRNEKKNDVDRKFGPVAKRMESRTQAPYRGNSANIRRNSPFFLYFRPNISSDPALFADSVVIRREKEPGSVEAIRSSGRMLSIRGRQLRTIQDARIGERNYMLGTSYRGI
jgi:hypothetical protein